MKNMSCDSKENAAQALRNARRIKKMSYNHQIIEGYMQKRDLPGWFRGSSAFQTMAVDRLSYALRDDMQQETTHRVSEILNVIGIQPTVSNKDIKVLMQYSGGNDLAFLWFLYELHYKTPGRAYTINEQLILSAITHLDMIPTLRELDRILPPRQLPLKVMRKEQREVKRALESAKAAQRAAMRAQKAKKYVNPYFERQPDPREHRTNMSLTPPDFIVQFPRYSAYSDPNFIQPNESNRWYADYKLQPERRIINRIINAEIADIFDDLEKASVKADTIRTLCEHHKVIDEMEKTLEAELRVIARDRCLKNIDVDKKRREECYKRVMDYLEQDIQLYMCQFRRLAERSRKRSVVQVLGKDNSCRCYVHDHTRDCKDDPEGGCDDGPFLLPCDMLAGCTGKTADGQNHGDDAGVCDGQFDGDAAVGDKQQKLPEFKACAGEHYISEAEAKRKMDAKILKRCIRTKLSLNGDSGDNTSTTSDDACSAAQCIGMGDGVGVRGGNTGIIFSALVNPQATEADLAEIASHRYSAAYDYGHTEDESPSPSQMFFEAPADNQPWLFDYRKIFNFKQNTPQLINIRRAFIAAVDSDIRVINDRMHKDSTSQLNAAIDNNVRKIWRVGVAEKTAQILAEEEERERREAAHSFEEKKWYDPNDRPLMKKMLKDGLERLKENPRYVLASMTDSHKLPSLYEWIIERYGKVYTWKERYRSFRTSVNIFRALARVTIRVKTPTQVGKSSFVKYSCRAHLMKKADEIRQDYYNKLDAEVMEQTRILWYAMRPYLCTGGPPRNTFFAYMPARIADITHFRLWKANEYMDAKRAHDKRMRKMDEAD